MLRDFRQILVLLGGGVATVAACHGSGESGSSGSCGSGPCADVATDVVSCDTGPFDSSDIGCGADCGPLPMACTPGQTQPCYDGAQPPVAPCAAGARTCPTDGLGFAYACEGEVAPTPDACDAPASWACGGTPIACGPALWATSFTDGGDEHATSVAVDSAGNAFVAGTTTGGSLKFGSQQVLADAGLFLAKVDEHGAPLWLQSLGGGSTIALAVDATGAVYATGVFTQQLLLPGKTLLGGKKPVAYLVKVGPGGQVAFARAYPTQGLLTPASIAVTSDGDLAIAGSYDGPNVRLGTTVLSPSSDTDAFVALLDPQGTPKWVTASSVGASLDAFASVAVDAEGRIFVAGTSTQPAAGCALSSPVFEAYKGDGGMRIWSNRPPFGGRGAAVVADGSGGLYATGPSSGVVTGDYAVEADGYVAHVAASGAVDWSRPLDFVGETLVLDRSALIVGGASVGAGAGDPATAHLVKFEQDGSRYYDHGYSLVSTAVGGKPVASIDAIALRADHGLAAVGTVRGLLQLGLGFSNVPVTSTTGLDAFVAEIGP